MEIRLAKGFLKRPSTWEAGDSGIAQSEHKPASNNDRLANRALSFQRTFIKLGLVHGPNCDSRKQASETASHILCDCEALATLQFRHLGHHFMKPGDTEDISVSKILHFVQGAGLLNA